MRASYLWLSRICQSASPRRNFTESTLVATSGRPGASTRYGRARDGSSNLAPPQAWYESGGTVTQGLLLISAAGFVPTLNQLIQPVPLIKRNLIAWW